MKLNLEVTGVFEKNYEAYQSGIRNIVNEGGSRSSKTYSIAQLFLIAALKQKDQVFSIVRKTLPSLRASAMRDFFDIMKSAGIYKEERHNKTELIYRFPSGSEIEFFSTDQPRKVRGRKRKYLWMNEANDFTLEDFRQLTMRTTGQVFLDYNPSDMFHWIYDHVLIRDDTKIIKSTYKDNPFLEKTIIQEIERYKGLDDNYWRIYGLGECGISETTIYKNWHYCDKLPECDEIIYGLDFGYNNPSALVKIGIKDKETYWKEMLYESYLTNSQLIEKLKTMEIGNKVIYCDSAEPQRIEELKKAGFNAKPSDKDVSKGIDTVKSQKMYITKDSVNLQKEVKSYSWKQKDDQVLDEPVKANDHLLDAGRYAIHTNNIIIKPAIFI